MKKLKVFGLIAVAIGLTASGDLFAQSSPLTGKNVIKYNLTATAIGHYAIQYERVINPQTILCHRLWHFAECFASL